MTLPSMSLNPISAEVKLDEKVMGGASSWPMVKVMSIVLLLVGRVRFIIDGQGEVIRQILACFRSLLSTSYPDLWVDSQQQAFDYRSVDIHGGIYPSLV